VLCSVDCSTLSVVLFHLSWLCRGFHLSWQSLGFQGSSAAQQRQQQEHSCNLEAAAHGSAAVVYTNVSARYFSQLLIVFVFGQKHSSQQMFDYLDLDDVLPANLRK
jgi:hypothetical protein